jgi:hypothetical protein
MLSLTCYEKLNLQNLRTLSDQVRIQDPKLYAQLMGMYTKADKKSGVFPAHYKANRVLGGRLFARGGLSLQYVDKRTRQIISAPSWDLDIENAYPTILMNLCESHQIKCPLLTDYVENRKRWFELGESPQQIKQDVIEFLFGSDKPATIPKLKEFKEEMKNVSARLVSLPTYTQLVKKVQAVKNKAIHSSAISYIIQHVEIDIMTDALAYIKTQWPVLSVQAYIYDGFMVQKNFSVNIEEVLMSLNERVSVHKVRFALKPFGIEHTDFEKGDLGPGEEVENDREALFKIIEKFPGYLRMCDGAKRVYDPDTGMWHSENNDAFGVFMRLAFMTHGNTKYGTMNRVMRGAYEMIVSLPNDVAFFKKGREFSLGKTMWLDCIYDQEEHVIKEFSPEIVFDRRVDRKFPRDVDPATVCLVEKYFFDDPFPNKRVRDVYRRALAQALTGRNPQRRVYFELGETATCKSTRVNALRRAFGDYIVTMGSKTFAKESFVNTGAPRPELLVLKNARIAFGMEMDPKIVISGSNLKNVSGGDEIAARDMYDGCIQTFAPHSTLFFSSNDMFIISPMDGALKDRLRVIQNEVQFLTRDDLPEENEFQKWRDRRVADFIDANPDALVYLLLVATDISELISDIPEIMCVTREVTGAQDNFEEILWENFDEGTPDDFVTARDVIAVFKSLSMSDVAVGRRMSKLEYPSKDKKVNKHTIKVYMGLKKKVAGF